MIFEYVCSCSIKKKKSNEASISSKEKLNAPFLLAQEKHEKTPTAIRKFCVKLCQIKNKFSEAQCKLCKADFDEKWDQRMLSFPNANLEAAYFWQYWTKLP